MSLEDFDKDLVKFYEPQIKKILEHKRNYLRAHEPGEAKPLTWRQEFRFWICGRRYWLADRLRQVVYWLEGSSPYDEDE